MNLLRKIRAWLGRPFPERGTYKNGKEAVLALVGYSIGLSNYWRFPYLCYLYGGGTFLIVYGLCVVCLGMPLYFMELVLGQYVSLGPTRLFSIMCPLLSGVGWGMVLILLFVSIYYNMFLAWTIFYMISSFTYPLPWSPCNHTYSFSDRQKMSDTAAEEYFNYGMLGKSTEENGGYEMQGWLVVCLALAWALVAVCLAGGIRGTGKVLYFTVIFPYIILACLLALNYDLQIDKEQHEHRVESFTTINQTKLLSRDIWYDAAIQVIFSFGVSHGSITTLSSYNSLHQNIIRDSFLVCLLDCATSLFCGYVLFSSSASFEDVDVDKHSKSTLVFITHSALLSRIDSSVWSFLFFFMILTLGLDSQFVMVEAVTTTLFDQFEIMRRHHLPVVVATCSVLFALGLPMCTSSGIKLVTLMDEYTTKNSLLMLGLLEVIIVCYIYGFQKIMKRVKKDLKLWVPWPLYWYWAITWQVITPLCLVALTVSSLYSQYSTWDSSMIHILGQIISFTPILFVPICALYTFCTRGDRSLRQLLNATADFCPGYKRIARPINHSHQVIPENQFYIDNAAFDFQE